MFAEVWAFWFLDTESERERTVKDNIARTSTATRRVGCCPRGTSRIRSFLGFTPSAPLATLLASSHRRHSFYLTLVCLECFLQSQGKLTGNVSGLPDGTPPINPTRLFPPSEDLFFFPYFSEQRIQCRHRVNVDSTFLLYRLVFC